MILFLKRPERFQAANNLLISRWGCARQPYLFELQRRDYPITFISPDLAGGPPGKVSLTCPYDADILTEVLVGDELYFASTLDSEGNAGHYGVTATIYRIDVAVGSIIIFRMDLDVESNLTVGGYFNIVKRKNYYAAFNLHLTDAKTGIVHSIPCKLKPGMNGKVRLDASEFITSYLVKEAPTVYSGVNLKDNNVWGKFYLTYTQMWTGSTNSLISDQSNEYFFVDAVKQLLDQYGQNLLSHLPFPELFAPGAKFLTEFVKPTFFPGYPFDLWFIYPDELATAPLTREEDEFTSSGAALSALSTSLNISMRGGVNRLRISETGYSPGTAQIDVYLKIYSGVQESYFVDNYIEDGYYELDPPIPPDGITPYLLTERKRVKIGEVCAKNAVYVCWKNRLGGFDYWLFNGNQNVNISSKQTGNINQEPDDIATQNYRSTFLQAEQVERITCGDNVLIEDLQGIKSIEASPAVYVLLSLSPITWKRVRVVPKGFQYQTKGNRADITVEFEYPETYTLSN
jgi:hypothetical protein